MAAWLKCVLRLLRLAARQWLKHHARNKACSNDVAISICNVRDEGLVVQVCFVTCNEWNYWEKCMEHDQQPVIPENPNDFVRIGTKVHPHATP